MDYDMFLVHGFLIYAAICFGIHIIAAIVD